MTTPSAIWAHISSGTLMAANHGRSDELHQTYGLTLGTPLALTATSRAVGAILQTIPVQAGETLSEATSGTVTATRS